MLATEQRNIEWEIIQGIAHSLSENATNNIPISQICAIMVNQTLFDTVREYQLDQTCPIAIPKGGWYHQMWIKRLYFGYVEPFTDIIVKSPILHNRVRLFAILAKKNIFDQVLILYIIMYL